MAWYRCGGGGLPAGLQSDMDTVLNKKFSTSTTYPPTDWPDTVNLMGPLPEKTASGAIANITDGADGVPLKNWLVTLPASLDGYTEVNGTKSGKNVIQNLKYQATSNRVNIGQSDDGFSISLRAGTYTLSVTSSINIRAYYRGSLDGSNTLIWSTYSTSGSGTFTLSEDKDVRMCVIGQDGSVSTSDILTIQLEVGSTATAYEAYTAPTTYTASLGRTIYGGTADIVTGEGEASFAYHKITADDEINLYTSANGFRIPTVSWTSGAMIYQANSGGLCNVLPTVTVSTGQGIRFGINNDQLYMVQCYDLFGSTVADFKTYVTNNDVYVVYRLATSTAFTFTPITPTPDTELGVNNFWADEGDSDVTYRADISLALQAINGGRGLMMMRPTEPEETEETEETEGLEDELNR